MVANCPGETQRGESRYGRPFSAAPRPPLYFPPILPRPADPANILPRGVELTTLQQSPDLASAWYSHLLTAGLFQDAEMFLHLLTSGGGGPASPAASIKPVQLTKNTTEGSKGKFVNIVLLCAESVPNTQLFAELQDKEKAPPPPPIHSPDSGCFTSPPGSDTANIEGASSQERRLAGEDKDGNIEDVFQSLLGE